MLKSIKQQAQLLSAGLPRKFAIALARTVEGQDLSTLDSLLDRIFEGTSADAVWLTWLLARLGEVSRRRIVWYLMRVVAADLDNAVTAEAIRGLATLSSDEALPEFQRRLEDKGASDDVRLACAYAIGHSKSDRGLPALIRVLRDREEHDALRGMAAEAIGLLGSGSSVATQTLIETLDDASNEVAYWIAYALAVSDAQQAVPVLRRAYERFSETWVRDEIKESLSILSGKS